MLKHTQDNSEPVPASQPRVTPEELTRALASIEARKQETIRRQEAEQAYRDKTIPIDEAVRELNLEATPEEIWAEVLTQRTAERVEKASPPPDRLFSRHPVSPLSFKRLKIFPKWQVASILLASFVLIFAHLYPPHNFAGVSKTPDSLALSSVQGFNVASFPNAISFQLVDHNLDKLLHGVDASKIHVDANSSYEPNTNRIHWPLIKYDNHIYLRGWVATPASQDTLEGHTIDIDNSPLVSENGNRSSEVTLRLDTLKFCSFYNRIFMPETPGYTGNTPGLNNILDEKITISDVHLDQHAWERAGNLIYGREPAIARSQRRMAAMDHVTQVDLARQTQKMNTDAQMLQKMHGTSLALYPNEKPFLLPSWQISYLMTGSPEKVVIIPPDQTDLNNPANFGDWLGIKHKGVFYLRGWVASDVGQNSVAEQSLHLYNSPLPTELGGKAKQISLRLGNFQYGPNGRFYFKQWYDLSPGIDSTGFIEQIPLSNVHLDKHAWEKW